MKVLPFLRNTYKVAYGIIFTNEGLTGDPVLFSCCVNHPLHHRFRKGLYLHPGFRLQSLKSVTFRETLRNLIDYMEDWEIEDNEM